MLDDGGRELVAGIRDRLHPGRLSSPLTERHCSRDNAKDAHRLLQTQTRTLDGTLRDLFTTWYSAMPANDVQPIPFTVAA